MSETGLFAYVSHTERGTEPGGEIRVLSLHPETGEVETLQTIPMPGKTMPLAISADRRFLHVASRSVPYCVSSFAIGRDGLLTHLADTALPDSMAYLSIDRSGRYLFGSSTAGFKGGPNTPVLSVSAIGEDGFVQPAHQVLRTRPKAHCIRATPANDFVLAASCDGDALMRHRFDATTGLLSVEELAPIRFRPGEGPRHFVFHPNRRWLYTLTEPGAFVYAFEFDARDATLRERQIVCAAPPESAVPGHGADIRITPDGRFLYASERASHTLACFRIEEASGALTHLGNFATEDYPRSFAIDPFGRFLICVGHKSNGLSVHRIARDTGRLTRSETVPMGRGPNWIEIVRL